MSQLITVQQEEKLTTLTLQNGKVNAISHELLDEFNAALDEASDSDTVLLIKGQPGMFSAGYDLNVMKEGDEAARKLVKRGSLLTQRLLSFPAPVIAVCTGHAIAKGAFLLLASDYRMAVDGDFKIGLNEVAIGMSMHHAGIELAKNRLNPAFFDRAVLCAEMFNLQGAVAAGFVDRIVPQEGLDVAIATVAQALGQLNFKAHRVTKLKARQSLLQALERAIELDAAPCESQ